MSLDWDCSKCPAGSMPANDTESGWRECLIWGSIAIDIGQITADNADEVLFRFRFLEQIGKGITTLPMTMEAIQRWIGLRTNVVTLTRAKWFSRVTKQLAQDVERDIKRESKNEAKVA